MKKVILISLVLFVGLIAASRYSVYKNYLQIKEASSKSLELIYAGKYNEAFEQYFDGTDYGAYVLACKGMKIVGWDGKYHASEFNSGDRKRAYGIEYFLESEKYPTDPFFITVIFYRPHKSDKFTELKFVLDARKDDREAVEEIKKFAIKMESKSNFEDPIESGR